MNLVQYYEKYVIVELIDHLKLEGYVSDYVEKEHNENEKESLIIDAIGYDYPIEFNESEILKIEVIEH